MEPYTDLLKFINVEPDTDPLKFANIRTFIVLGANISFVREGSYNTNIRSYK